MKFLPATVLAVILMVAPALLHGQERVILRVRVADTSGTTSENILRRNRIGKSLSVPVDQLERRISFILKAFEESGHPFARVQVDSLQAEGANLSGILAIHPGGRVVIDTLMNRTGVRISAPVLARLAGIRPGDLYRESAIRESAARVARTRFLVLSRPTEVGFHPGKAAVYLFPEKVSANRFDGWIGLAPQTYGGGSLAFSGALALNLFNVAGQAESWMLDWRRNPDRSQRLSASVSAPYLAGLPLGFSGDFGLFRQDTSYLNLDWTLSVPFSFDPGNRLSLFVKHRESSVVGNGSGLLEPFNATLSGVRWELDRLDSPVNPFRGIRAMAEGGWGRKTVSDSPAVSHSELNLALSGFIPIAGKFTCGIILNAGAVISPEVPDNGLLRLGGIDRLRGFGEDEFLARDFAVGSLEFRYLLDGGSHLVLLGDAGIFRKGKASGGWSLPMGFGAGGQIRTAGGIFRIILALGKYPGEPVNLGNSKIHLGYVGLF